MLKAERLFKPFRGPDGVDRTVVNDVSFELQQGETLGIVGESGSGKTTTARLALALLEVDDGGVTLAGEEWSGLPERERRKRRADISVIYQDPLCSFDPRWTVEQIMLDALGRRATATGRRRKARIAELLEMVGLEPDTWPPAAAALRRPAPARRDRPGAGPQPRVIVCDEPVSALDVSIQAQVLDLLADLQQELGSRYLFISHDLGVIHHISDRVLVMNDGKVVEFGDADDVLLRPHHPYTKKLVASLPALEQPEPTGPRPFGRPPRSAGPAADRGARRVTRRSTPTSSSSTRSRSTSSATASGPRTATAG